MRAFLKCKDDLSILAIQNRFKSQIKFTFKEMDLASIEKEILSYKINKASQILDIQTKIIMKNVDIFAEFLWKSINSSIKSFTFSACFRLADMTC